MVSIESDCIGYCRAQFNRPYRTVVVEYGTSSERLPHVLAQEGMGARPWVLWLDYDKALDEGRCGDLRWAIENLPPNSVLLTTFGANGAPYASKPRSRPDSLRRLFGASVPDSVQHGHCSEGQLPLTLAKYAQDWLVSVASNAARPGGYLPCFSIPYRDGNPMVTIGGVLPGGDDVLACKDIISSAEWSGRYEGILEAPHLTVREVSALQGLLPAEGAIDRDAVRSLGFDLEETQIGIFERFYTLYPSFAQVVG